MTRTEHLLLKLAEECAEVIERVTKAMIFGTDEVQPDQPHTNIDRVLHEFIDLLAAFEMLHEDAVFAPRTFTVDAFARERMEAKKAKVERFLKFSAARGKVDGETPDSTYPHPEAAHNPLRSHGGDLTTANNTEGI